MPDFPVSGYVSGAGRTVGEEKQAFEDWLAATKQLPGAAAETTLTIATGVVTPTRAVHQVDTEGGVGTDDLTNIAQTNLPDGSLLQIRPVSSSRVVTVKHSAGGAGQISLQRGADLALRDPNQMLTLRRIGSLWQEAYVPSSTFLPAGTILMWSAAAAPFGFLLCDGTAVSRATYAELFAAISTTYGVGDGSTTFNLPNLKGRVVVGCDAGQTEFDALGETGGAKTATAPAHTHTQQGNFFTSTAPAGVQFNTGSGTFATLAHNHDVTISGSTSTESTSQTVSTLQPYIALPYIIKT